MDIDTGQDVGSRRGAGESVSAQSNAVSSGPKSASSEVCSDVTKSSLHLFTSGTKAIIWGLQSRAVQGMIDFDYVCSRQSPSVVAMVYPFV